MELSYYGYSNFGWNYPNYGFQILDGTTTYMDGDILITMVGILPFRYGYEQIRKLLQQPNYSIQTEEVRLFKFCKPNQKLQFRTYSQDR
jgi:hypothetical protein